MTQTVAPADPSAAAPTSGRSGRSGRSPVTAPRLVLAALVVAALVLRWSLLDIQTGDYRAFLDPLVHPSATGDRPVRAGRRLLELQHAVPGPVGPDRQDPDPRTVAIKTISVIFDLLLAFFAFRISPPSGPAPLAADLRGRGGAVPAHRGDEQQRLGPVRCDLCLAVPGQPVLPDQATGLAGLCDVRLAFAFKLQAVFFAAGTARRVGHQPDASPGAVGRPGGLLRSPAAGRLAGRSLLTQLLTYPNQIDRRLRWRAQAAGRGGGGGFGAARQGTGGAPSGSGLQPGHAGGLAPGAGRGGGFGGGAGGAGGGTGGGTGSVGTGSVGTGHAFTDNAPTWYAWLPADAATVWKYVGFGLAAAVAVVFAVILVRRRRLSSRRPRSCWSPPRPP